jgi:hypothetical protein
MNDTPDFKTSEFICRHCGGGAWIVSQKLVDALQCVRDAWGRPMQVNCGYRCPAHNHAVGGAPDSAHLTGEAADIADVDGLLKLWLTEERLIAFGLWMEDPQATPTWAHLQVRPARNRIFAP